MSRRNRNAGRSTLVCEVSDEPKVIAAIRQSLAYLVAGDVNALTDLAAEDLRFEDRRMGLGSTLDKQGNIEQLRAVVDVGVGQADFDVIETRGERFALYRMALHAADFLVSTLAVAEVDDRGHVRTTVLFDEDDLDVARAELDEISGEST